MFPAGANAEAAPTRNERAVMNFILMYCVFWFVFSVEWRFFMRLSSSFSFHKTCDVVIDNVMEC